MLGHLMDRYYPMTSEGVRYRDGTKPFYDWIFSAIPANGVVLNIGAGPTPEPRRRLQGHFRRLVGVDPDPIVMSNADLDEAHVNNGVRLPFPDATFDGAYSDWTLEHVNEPLAFLREVRRVLKPGASFFARTTNRMHYVTVVSAITPHWFHRLIANRARRLPGNAHDPWPTHYRMNTPQRLRRLALRAGFQPEIRLLEPEPAYMMFHPAAFLLGVGYERLVNRVGQFAPARLILLVRMCAGLRDTAR